MIERALVPDLKRRMRDVTRFVESAASEVSRQVKTPSQQEREAMRQAAAAGAAGLDHDFLKAELPEPATPTPKKKKTTVKTEGQSDDEEGWRRCSRGQLSRKCEEGQRLF